MKLFLLKARIKNDMSGIMAYSKPVDVTDDEDGQLQQFYSCIGCDTVDMLEISIGGRKFDIIVDDEGRYKPLAIPSFSMPDGAVFLATSCLRTATPKAARPGSATTTSTSSAAP